MADLAELVRKGLAISEGTYGEALRYFAQCRKEIVDLCAVTPVILSPAATGPAPRGGG